LGRWELNPQVGLGEGGTISLFSGKKRVLMRKIINVSADT